MNKQALRVGDRVKVLSLPTPDWSEGRRPVGWVGLVTKVGVPNIELGQGYYTFADRLQKLPDGNGIDCSCGPFTDSRLCPEHGPRCRNVDCDDLVYKNVEAYGGADGRKYCSKQCHDAAQASAAKSEPMATASDSSIRAMTDALPANVAARARNVAALTKDLDRPAPVRFPPEGRSDRVFNGRRW